MRYSERAERYAQDVVAGRIQACLYVRLACQRHLDDLAAQKLSDVPYRFDPDAADLVCAFVEELPHIKGDWAKRNERIHLEDWQCFVVAVPFGWKRKADGLRRYRRVYIEVPRKNAKSTLTAGLGLYMLTMDGEHGAEVYSGAGTEKQAWEVFGPAREMAKRSPDLLDFADLEVHAKNLSILQLASKFEPVIGKPGDGASPTFSITDEYHEHKTDEQYDTMLTGMGSRRQPMSWVITTAGTDTAGPCYRLRSEVVASLQGTIPNEQLWGIVYTIDADDDWTSEDALRKANPNYDVSVFGEYLRSQQLIAINNPEKQSTFQTKHLDVWVTAASPYFNLEKWKRLGDPTLSAEDFVGEPCWIGLDLAAKLDLTVDGKLFRREEADGREHFYWFPRFYLPEERASDPTLAHYGGWVERGYIEATPGNITHYDYIEDNVKADAERFRIVQLGFDPWNASQIANHLMEHGIECVEVPQTAKNLSDPMKWVQALIEDGRIHHDGNPVMTWCIGNVTAQMDRNDNVFPRKEQPHNKIDGVVALILAKGRAIDTEEVGSIYESGESLWL